MLKHEAKKLIVDRARSKYIPSICQILLAILSTVRLHDVKKAEVESGVSQSKLQRIARVAMVSVDTVERAIKKLEHDGLITVHRNQGRDGQRHFYSVHVESLKQLPYYKEKIALPAIERLKNYREEETKRKAMLKDFEETIRMDIDKRTPEEIRTAQLPTRWTLAQSNVSFESAALPASKDFMKKLKHAEAAFDAKYPEAEAAAA